MNVAAAAHQIIRLVSCISPSPTLRSGIFVLFLAGVVSYGVLFAWYVVYHFDVINYIRDVNNDDAFYYFQTARNLAAGHFSTFDGGITRTNGYHPVWLLLITPIYWVSDRESALAAIKALEIVLTAAGAALVVVAARLARLVWPLLFAILPALLHERSSYGGLEGAAGLFWLGSLFVGILLFVKCPRRWRWLLASIVFSLPWVRLEYAAISVAATAVLCLIKGLEDKSLPPVYVRTHLAAWAGILIYFAYNRLIFGGMVPVSGATKAAASEERWEAAGGYSLVQNFQDVLQVSVIRDGVIVSVAVCGLAVAAWSLTGIARRRGVTPPQSALFLAFMTASFGLAAGHLAKFAQTVLTVHPLYGSYGWYFIPAYLMNALIVPLGCYTGLYLLRLLIAPKWDRAAHVMSVALVVVCAVLLARNLVGDFVRPFQYAHKMSMSTHREWEVSSYAGVQVLNRLLPDGSVVGSWDSGVVGYFSDFPVVNLDGLMNTYDYLRARTAGELELFYSEYGITHFANARPVATRNDGTLFEGVSFWRDPHTEYNFKVWSNQQTQFDVPDLHSVGWEALEPLFHYEVDGLSILVGDRLVQVFAKDCNPKVQPSVFMVTWDPGGARVRTEDTASAWRENSLGYCVEAFERPNGASQLVGISALTIDAYVEQQTQSVRLAADQPFNVLTVGDRLVYVRHNCTGGDAEAGFFLHVIPVDRFDLPLPFFPTGFENLDFRLTDYGLMAGDTCIVSRSLPEYEIAAVRTGQYNSEGPVWEATVYPSALPR